MNRRTVSEALAKLKAWHVEIASEYTVHPPGCRECTLLAEAQRLAAETVPCDGSGWARRDPECEAAQLTETLHGPFTICDCDPCPGCRNCMVPKAALRALALRLREQANVVRNSGAGSLVYETACREHASELDALADGREAGK